MFLIVTPGGDFKAKTPINVYEFLYKCKVEGDIDEIKELTDMPFDFIVYGGYTISKVNQRPSASFFVA